MLAIPSRPILRYHGGKWLLAPGILKRPSPRLEQLELPFVPNGSATYGPGPKWFSDLLKPKGAAGAGGGRAPG